jgi:hypothetical protein
VFIENSHINFVYDCIIFISHREIYDKKLISDESPGIAGTNSLRAIEAISWRFR